MNVISGVGVSGAGVELGSPTGTVSVGKGVFGIVAVGEAVQVATSRAVGDVARVGDSMIADGVISVGTVMAVGCGPKFGPKLLIYSVTAVTQTVPITPMSAAIMVGSIPLLGFSLDLDILVPGNKICNSTACS